MGVWYLQWSWPLPSRSLCHNCIHSEMSTVSWSLHEVKLSIDKPCCSQTIVQLWKKDFSAGYDVNLATTSQKLVFCGTSWSGTSNSLAVRENIRHLFLMLCLIIKLRKHSIIYFSVCLCLLLLFPSVLHCVLLSICLSCIGYDDKTE